VILFGKVVRRLNDQQPLAHETPPTLTAGQVFRVWFSLAGYMQRYPTRLRKVLEENGL